MATNAKLLETTAIMVDKAIKTLKGKRGTSLYRIKQFIKTDYNVDIRRRAPTIRKYLRYAVDQGKLVQMSGRGASGSFKFAKGMVPLQTTTKSKSTPPRRKTSKKPTKTRSPGRKND